MNWYYMLATFLLLTSCNITNTHKKIESHSEDKQVLRLDHTGEGGSCYAQALLNQTKYWVEVVCDNNVSKQLVSQIQEDLIALGYSIETDEIERAKFSTSTKQAFVAFQRSQELAYGALDIVSINRLHQEVSKQNK